MSTAQQLESIANTLETYRTHLAAVSHALNALRSVSEQMIEALDRDRAALATHLQQAAETAMAQSVEIAEQPAHGDAASAHAVEIDGGLVGEAEEILPSGSATEIEEIHAEVAASEAAIEIAEPTAENEPAIENIEVGETEAAEVEAEVIVAAETVVTENLLTETVVAAAEQAAPAADAEVTSPESAAEEAKPAAIEETGNVVALATRRKSRLPLSPARRRAAAVVASLVVCVTATLGTYEFMQTEMGQQLLQLSSCDGDMLSAQRDCNLLSWLHI